MDEIEVDLKLVIKTICISILIGTILWIGYNIYISLTKNENEGIAKFDGDNLSEIESIGTIESDLIDDDFYIMPSPEKKFQINNENPINTPKDWGEVTVNYGECSIKYSAPGSTEKLKGENRNSTIIDMSTWTEDGTYEEFIEDFTSTLKSYDKGTEMKYTIRNLNINGQEFKVIKRESEYVVFSYFCLAKDGKAYLLELITEKKYYDDSLENTIDQIFSTFTII